MSTKTVPQHLIDQAATRGIVPGAECKSPYSGEVFKIGPSSEWRTQGHNDEDIASPGLFIRYNGEWAEVVTPAPSTEEGLKEGDGCRTTNTMVLAITACAKELGVSVADVGNSKSYTVVALWNGKIYPAMPTSAVDERIRNRITPAEFLRKLEVTGRKSNFRINGSTVEFHPGHIMVGGNKVDNTTINAIVGCIDGKLPEIKAAGYTVEFRDGAIQLGCQRIPHDTVRAIAKALKP